MISSYSAAKVREVKENKTWKKNRKKGENLTERETGD